MIGFGFQALFLSNGGEHTAMDTGAGSFQVEFDSVFDVVIGNAKEELLLLLVIHLGD